MSACTSATLPSARTKLANGSHAPLRGSRRAVPRTATPPARTSCSPETSSAPLGSSASAVIPPLQSRDAPESRSSHCAAVDGVGGAHVSCEASATSGNGSGFARCAALRPAPLWPVTVAALLGIGWSRSSISSIARSSAYPPGTPIPFAVIARVTPSSGIRRSVLLTPLYPPVCPYVRSVPSQLLSIMDPSV